MKAKKIAAFVLPIIIVVGLDRFTKHLIRTTPSLHHWTLIPGVIDFDYTLNPGMAMGIDWLSTPTISIIAIIFTICIIGYICYMMKNAGIGFLVLWGMIVGGALGNIIDRLILAKIEGYGGILDGHVVDFIHFTPTVWGYPVFPYIFNIADASITVAIICLVIFHKTVFQVQGQADEADQDEEKAVSGKSRLKGEGAEVEGFEPPES